MQQQKQQQQVQRAEEAAAVSIQKVLRGRSCRAATEGLQNFLLVCSAIERAIQKDAPSYHWRGDDLLGDVPLFRKRPVRAPREAILELQVQEEVEDEEEVQGEESRVAVEATQASPESGNAPTPLLPPLPPPLGRRQMPTLSTTTTTLHVMPQKREPKHVHDPESEAESREAVTELEKEREQSMEISPTALTGPDDASLFPALESDPTPSSLKGVGVVAEPDDTAERVQQSRQEKLPAPLGPADLALLKAEEAWLERTIRERIAYLSGVAQQ